MTEAPTPIAQAVKAETDARIAMSAAWLVVSFLDHSGNRRRLSGDFMDSMKILVDELAEAGYLARYKALDGTLHLPPIEPSGLRASKTEPADSDMTISRRTLKGSNP